MAWLSSGLKMSLHVRNLGNQGGAPLVVIGSQIALITQRNLDDVFARWIIIALGWEGSFRKHVSDSYGKLGYTYTI